MSDFAAVARMTPAAYLEWERRQEGKHEYRHGEVSAMPGGSPRHHFLSAAAAGELRAALRSRGCHVLSGDQRISASEGARYVYPDAVVVCGELQMEPGTTDVLTNPTVVVEVLSPTTEAFDRGATWDAYQRLPSLTDYVLVAQDGIHVEHYGREADGSWRYRLHEAGGTVALASGAELSSCGSGGACRGRDEGRREGAQARRAMAGSPRTLGRLVCVRDLDGQETPG